MGRVAGECLSVSGGGVGGTVYIDRKDAELRLEGRALAVYVSGDRTGTVPLVPLDRIVLVGQIHLQTRVLHRLAAEGIDVVFLSGKRQTFSGRLVGRVHRHGRVRVAQYQQSHGALALSLSRQWVDTKLERQQAVLRELAEAKQLDGRLAIHAQEVFEAVRPQVQAVASLEQLRGLEGAAAAAYFRAFATAFPPSLQFQGRQRRPPTDPVNALLSLTYTLVHWEWVRECETIGLDPVIGFYHEFDYGRDSLACDLMEPTRPLIDHWVWTLFHHRQLTGRDFSSDQERPGCYLKKSARSRYYQVYETWMAERRALMRAEVARLVQQVLHGEHAGEDAVSF
ncbi:MAG: CRISPR-associated endonuclease Cas1 [Nitrospirae bacterium]|nr:MAG: CRISPR-associated endonuclease Cas1 [Nitrospirota bacterium]